LKGRAPEDRSEARKNSSSLTHEIPSDRLGGYPEVQAKVKQHLVETEQQLGRLESGRGAGKPPRHAGDELLQNSFANNAFERFEIAEISLVHACQTGNVTATA
jgi:hypothetical protein